MTDITIRKIEAKDKPEWLRMRLALWPNTPAEKHQSEMDAILLDPMQPVFIAIRSNGKPGGFLEAGTRNYAEGCKTSPVAYIEGWYVDENLRGKGVGKALIDAAEKWACKQGLTEIASDTWLDNEVSIQAHVKLGYDETERLVHFMKKLG